METTLLHSFNGKQYPIGVKFPDGYDRSRNYPAKFFCHGNGEKGDGSVAALSSVSNFLNSCNLTTASNKFGFILIYTQITWSMPNWTADYINAMLDYAKSLPIDFKVLTGVSLGGGGVWLHASVSPGVFNVYVPVCPIEGMSNPKGIAASGSPVLAFHAQDDGTVPAETTKTYVNQINAQSPKVPATLTLYPKGNHYIWNRVYDPTTSPGINGETGTLHEWELSVRSKTPIVVPPPVTTPVKAVPSARNVTGTTATLDGSTSTGVTWAAWEMINPNPATHPPVFPNWDKGGLVKEVNNLIPGTTYTFRLTINGNVSSDISFPTPKTQPAPTIVASSNIPAGKTKVNYMSDGTFQFL